MIYDDVGVFETPGRVNSNTAGATGELQRSGCAGGNAPLHARMQREGRLVTHGRLSAGTFWETNIRPKLMSPEQLDAGARWLINRIYSPAAIGRRVQKFIEASPAPTPASRVPLFAGGLALALARRLGQYGEDEQKLLRLLEAAA